MKITGTPSDQQLTQTERTERDRAVTHDAARRRAGGATDEVSLSTEARSLAHALKAADLGPQIRRDKVDQARQKLESGELGRDTIRLAESIIDHLIDQGPKGPNPSRNAL